MKNQNYQTDEKMREVKGECESKKRYLKDTAFQLEMIKWLFLSFTLIIFGASRYIKYCLLLLLVWDLFQTKYLFGIKYFKHFKYFKYLLNTIIILLFIMNLKMLIIRNVIEAILIIILIYILNQKFAKTYNEFMELELDGGKNEE